MLRVLRCMPEAVEGELCLQEVPEVPEMMRCVLRCMLEAMEGGLWAQFRGFEISIVALFPSYSPPPKKKKKPPGAH